MSTLDNHPRYTDQIKGHDKILADLIQKADQGLLSSAYVFCGPQGIGKSTTAYLLARHLLYRPSASGSLFGQALQEGDEPSTTLIKTGNHPNLHVVVADPGRKSDDISVEEVRAAQHFLQQTSMDDAWRIVLVDAADNLTRQAANALLKFLEEPPQRVLFILICHQPGRLLPTLRSRCQRITFSSLSVFDFQSVLLKRFPEKSLKQIEAMAPLYRGRIGPAFTKLSASDDGDDLAKVIELLEHPEDALSWYKFAISLSGLPAMDRYVSVQELILNTLSLIVRAHAIEGGEHLLIPPFTRASKALKERHTVKGLSEIWMKVKAAFDQTESAHLDRAYPIEHVGRLLRVRSA